MKKHIPNALTCSNLISGCMAVKFAFAGSLDIAFLCITIGAVFDFFDGFTARLLGVSSPIGKELDSLADCITFGFAPATIVFMLLSESALPAMPGRSLLPYIAFLIAAFSALRLAKFNLDARQATEFIGMPTPANALLWGSLALFLWTRQEVLQLPWVGPSILLGVLLCCWLLVSEVHMFALKFKHFGWKGNEIRYGFLLVAALLIFLLYSLGFTVSIVLYLTISVACNALKKRL